MPDKHYRRKEDIKSCPFCGNDKQQLNTPADNDHSHSQASVFCLGCAASVRGPDMQSAINKWNRRA